MKKFLKLCNAWFCKERYSLADWLTFFLLFFVAWGIFTVCFECNSGSISDFMAAINVLISQYPEHLFSVLFFFSVYFSAIFSLFCLLFGFLLDFFAHLRKNRKKKAAAVADQEVSEN